MDTENKRVLDLIKFLIINRKIKNTTDFAKKIKHDQGSLTKILDGTRGVTPAFRWKIYDTFHIDKHYLFDGIGEPCFEPTQETITDASELNKAKALIKILRNDLKSHKKTIQAQEMTISSLQKQLELKITINKKQVNQG